MTHELSDTQDIATRVGALMGQLRKTIEKRGWTFYVEPPLQVLPGFLEGHRPDALGIGPDGGVVIEIKTYRQETRDSSLTTIAKLVEDQKGWDFRIFYVSPPAEADSDLPTSTSDEIESGIVETRVLLETGHERAALVIAWSLLEAVARLVGHKGDGTKARPLSPAQTVQTLAEMGYLEEHDAQRLRKLTDLRNSVVHGALGTSVPADDVAQLIHDLEKITHSFREAA